MMNDNLSAILRWLYPQGGYRVQSDGNGPYISFWDQAITGDPQPTVAEVMAEETAYLAAGGFEAGRRVQAKTLLDAEPSPILKLLRALALVTMDDENILRQWNTDFKAAVAAATSLADLKTRVAALPTLGQRTKLQLYNAIKSLLDGGGAD